MSKVKAFASLLFLVLLIISSSVAPARHEDFDQAEDDITPMIYTLGIVHENIVMGMNKTLQVYHNLSVEEELVFHYSQRELNSSYEYMGSALDYTEPARRVMEEIEGEVWSYTYLYDLYLPYYEMASSGYSVSEDHKGILQNIGSAVEIYNLVEAEEIDHARLLEGMQSIHKALDNIGRIDSETELMRTQVEKMNETVAERDDIVSYLDAMDELLQSYRETIDILLGLYDEVPHHLSVFSPDVVHPGQEFTVYGFIVGEGELIEQKEVTVEFDDLSHQVFTDEDGQYSLELEVPWDVTGEMEITASAFNEFDLEAHSIVTVERYPTEMLISADKRAYFDEQISIEGRFLTEAPVDLSLVKVHVNDDEPIRLNRYGNMTREYHSSDFGWGVTELKFEYLGNSTLKPATEYVVFDVSIPTLLLLETSDMGEVSNPITLEGRLINTSSEEGIEGDVRLYLDDEHRAGTSTDQEGFYEFELDVSGLETGSYTLQTKFEGTDRYRSSRSDIYHMRITEDRIIIDPEPIPEEDGEDEIFGWVDPQEGWGGLILVLVLVVVVAVFLFKKETEVGSQTVEKKVEPTLLEKKVGPPEFVSEKDVVPSYGQFLNELVIRDIISFKPGITHREIQERLVDNFGISDHFKEITDTLEKKVFAETRLSNEDLQSYLHSLKKVWEVCLT